MGSETFLGRRPNPGRDPPSSPSPSSPGSSSPGSPPPPPPPGLGGGPPAPMAVPPPLGAAWPGNMGGGLKGADMRFQLVAKEVSGANVGLDKVSPAWV